MRRNPTLSVEEIRCLVEDDDLVGAANLLSKLIEKCERRKLNEVSIIKRSICAVERQERTGVLDYDHINRERSRLGLAILDLVDMVCG